MPLIAQPAPNGGGEFAVLIDGLGNYSRPISTKSELAQKFFDQAEYLMHKGYYLAAGVFFRAVLEEKLRRLSETHGLILDKEHPTISDFNQALYRANIFDKIT